MKKAIAKIKIAPGNVAWYDPLNNIYLTLTSPEAKVYDNYDLTNIHKGIKYNYIIITTGNLNFKNNENTKVKIKSKAKINSKTKTKVNSKTIDDMKISKDEFPKDNKDKNSQLKGKKKSKKNPKKETSEVVEFDKEIIKDDAGQILSITKENSFDKNKSK